MLVQDDSRIQRPIYYVSHILSEPEEQYPSIERLTFTLVLAARKVHLYFQVHLKQAIIDQPLKQVLSRFDVSEWLLRWSIELGKFDI